METWGMMENVQQDTLDCVVIGGYLDKGGGMYRGFLVACYDNENEAFETICKVGAGFDGEDLFEQTKFFKQQIIDSPQSNYIFHPSIKPDHWFNATRVWEIKGAGLTLTSVFEAAKGLVDPNKGICLRFPRFHRTLDDKKPEGATTVYQVAEMYYRAQSQLQASSESDKEDLMHSNKVDHLT